MRKIIVPCVTCPDDPRYRLAAVWVVGDSTAICGECRLIAINWMRAQGFSLAQPHPFTDHLCDVSREPYIVRLGKKV